MSIGRFHCKAWTQRKHLEQEVMDPMMDTDPKHTKLFVLKKLKVGVCKQVFLILLIHANFLWFADNLRAICLKHPAAHLLSLWFGFTISKHYPNRMLHTAHWKELLESLLFRDTTTDWGKQESIRANLEMKKKYQVPWKFQSDRN